MPNRILWIDVFRGISILAMIIFHFAFDLMFFGFTKPNLIYQPDWQLFQRTIASSFLFLAGLSLFITHQAQINWKSFFRRYGATTAFAILISICFRVNRFIFIKIKFALFGFISIFNFFDKSFNIQTIRRS